MGVLLLALGALGFVAVARSRQVQAAQTSTQAAAETYYPAQTPQQESSGSQDMLGGLLGLFGGGGSSDSAGGAAAPQTELSNIGVDFVQQGIQANLQLMGSLLEAKEAARENLAAWNKAVTDTIRSGYYDTAINSGLNNYKIEQRIFTDIMDPASFGGKVARLSEAQMQGHALTPTVETELQARRKVLQPDIVLQPSPSPFTAERTNVAEILASGTKTLVSRFW